MNIRGQHINLNASFARKDNFCSVQPEMSVNSSITPSPASSVSRHPISDKLASQNQHGFISSKSYLANLPSFSKDLTARMDTVNPVEIVNLDFSTAFYSVNCRPPLPS